MTYGPLNLATSFLFVLGVLSMLRMATNVAFAVALIMTSASAQKMLL